MKITEQFFEKLAELNNGEDIWNSLKPIFKNQSEFENILLQILNFPTQLESRYRSLRLVSWFIFQALREDSLEFRFIRSNTNMISFQEYMYKWARFGMKRIPFGEWSDIAQKGTELLRELLAEKSLLEYESDARFKSFMRDVSVRHETLSAKYSELKSFSDE